MEAIIVLLREAQNSPFFQERRACLYLIGVSSESNIFRRVSSNKVFQMSVESATGKIVVTTILSVA